MFYIPKDYFYFTNSADPDEMQHFVAFIWVFTVYQSTYLVKWLNIQVQLSIVAQAEGGGKQKSFGKTKLNLLDCLIRCKKSWTVLFHIVCLGIT